MTFPARTSIVILTHNELEYTRRCLASIASCTAEPYELVLVDNGSTDGTVDYLRSQAGAVVIENGENLGFAAGCNQGIAAARGERILLLNNDTVATPGWLAALHGALDADPSRGIAGPRSNHVSGDQLVTPVPYDVWTLEGLDGFAAEWRSAHAGQGRELRRLIGFCMLAKREVFERIGGFDLRFGIGNFEDDDLCLRANVAGFKTWMCDEAFVHHFGSRTFEGQHVPYQHRLEEAWAHFESKWHPRHITDDAGNILGYEAADLVSGTRFDERRHYEPLVAAVDTDSVVRIERRAKAVLVAADRHHPDETAAVLRGTLATFAPDDPVTVVVRIDPADRTTLPQLEALADALEDDLPDIAVLEASDRNDMAAVSACDAVVVPEHRRAAWAMHGLARHCGVPAHPTSVLRAAVFGAEAAV